MSTVRISLVAAALVAGLVVAGCGGSGNKQQTNVQFQGAAVGGARVSVGDPAGGGSPSGVVLLIHGGGWQRSDAEYASLKANAKNFQAQGYATVTIGYDTGAKGFQQVVDVYKQARKKYPGVPICASGISAGGHLALMLATREPDLTCVVTLVAPTDLTTLARQDPNGQEAYNAAVTAFGADQLAKFSPVRYADKIKAKVLMIEAQTDPIDPVAQGHELARALPGSELLVLPPGPVIAAWAHSAGVQPDAQNIVIKREFDFLRQATAQAQGG
jgi:dipeptidyl aminopeptidase/acylaminoacyl peptidase